jgi:hypothetical protein
MYALQNVSREQIEFNARNRYTIRRIHVYVNNIAVGKFTTVLSVQTRVEINVYT